MKQTTSDGERHINYIAYAITKVRGEKTEVIEDLPTVLDTKVTVKVAQKPSRVYTAPDMQELEFAYEDGKVTYVVPRFECSTLVVIE